MATILFRESTPKDFDAMVTIVKKLPAYFVPEYVKDVEEDIRSQKSILAISDDKILGFINYKVHSPKKAEILWMAVDPTIQSQGVGTLLMNDFLGDMQNQHIKVVELSTIASSDRSAEFQKTRRFYEKFGFKEVRIDKDYYGPGDDRGVMKKEL
jgi:ribosomal protein S18 acetylase RimI-like enzyme